MAGDTKESRALEKQTKLLEKQAEIFEKISGFLEGLNKLEKQKEEAEERRHSQKEAAENERHSKLTALYEKQNSRMFWQIVVIAIQAGAAIGLLFATLALVDATNQLKVATEESALVKPVLHAWFKNFKSFEPYEEGILRYDVNSNKEIYFGLKNLGRAVSDILMTFTVYIQCDDGFTKNVQVTLPRDGSCFNTGILEPGKACIYTGTVTKEVLQEISQKQHCELWGETFAPDEPSIKSNEARITLLEKEG